MKKVYKKPYIGVESFQLNASIAVACSTNRDIPINHGESTCSYEGEFYSYVNCNFDLTGPENDGNDTPCYHGPFITGNISFTYS